MSDNHRYWGGWTEKGRALHYVVSRTYGCPVSACGRSLESALDIPAREAADWSKCKLCVRAAEGDES